MTTASTAVPPTGPARQGVFDLETIRFRSEVEFADALAASGVLREAGNADPAAPAAERVRRLLLATHLRLSENMAPEVFAHAREAAVALGLTQPVEIYQAGGGENAAHWRCGEVVFISLEGQMMSLLDR